MALNMSYLVTTKNLDNFLNTIISAQAPERFSQKFLENLEFKSTNDRLFIGLLKSLNFLDEGGVPTQRYFDFLDQTLSKQILAKSIEEAYSDLFSIRKDAYNLTVEEVKNKLKTLTQGQKKENILALMANTFKALCEYADWKTNRPGKDASKEKTPHKLEEKEVTPTDHKPNNIETISPSLNYNIQIHLPETRDNAVYDAIFKSLKEHLLR